MQVPKLSGFPEPPYSGAVSSPSLTVELFSIGGFCCASAHLPPKEPSATRFHTPPVAGNGLNPSWGHTVHCMAAEPTTTILKLSVNDGDTEVAYECIVLGVLRPGYRCVQLRSKLGTKIEMCFLMLHITIGERPNPWTPAYDRRGHRRNGIVEADASEVKRMVDEKYPHHKREREGSCVGRESAEERGSSNFPVRRTSLSGLVGPLVSLDRLAGVRSSGGARPRLPSIDGNFSAAVSAVEKDDLSA